jgi:Zn-dependent metalloprotease
MQLQARLLSAAVLAALAVSAPALAAKSDAPAALRAKGMIDTHAAAVQRADADAFVVRDVMIDGDGTEHVRFDRTYRGLPVIGGDVVMHSRNNLFKAASLTLKTTGRPGIDGKLDSADAITAAGVEFGVDFNGVPTARKVVYARGNQPVLAWEVEMKGTRADGALTHMHYFIDASSGQTLDRWDEVQTAAAIGIGKTFIMGDVTLDTNSTATGFELVDTTRGNGSTYDANNVTYSSAASTATLFTDSDNVWGDNTKAQRQTAAAEAHYGVSETWDFYKNTLGRNGIWNDGRGAKSYVHVGTAWGNASWYANAMYYGDGGSTTRGMTALDVAGHEMSHGVNSATAKLVYSADAGGLNEGNSDIMGTLVEFYANNANDPGDYTVGEEVFTSGVLRYMFKPSLDGKSFDCYPTRGFGSKPAHDPHYTSGVANHFFYLLAEGAVVPASHTASLTKASLVCNANTALVGIGRAKAGAIWYRALTTYMTSSSTYPGARTATLNAARDLYGTGSAEYNAVAAAWSAVSVN